MYEFVIYSLVKIVSLYFIVLADDEQSRHDLGLKLLPKKHNCIYLSVYNGVVAFEVTKTLLDLKKHVIVVTDNNLEGAKEESRIIVHSTSREEILDYDSFQEWVHSLTK